MAWGIRAMRGVALVAEGAMFPSHAEALRQLAKMLEIQTRVNGRRIEFDQEWRVAIYDGGQYIDTLWIENSAGHRESLEDLAS